MGELAELRERDGAWQATQRAASLEPGRRSARCGCVTQDGCFQSSRSPAGGLVHRRRRAAARAARHRGSRRVGVTTAPGDVRACRTPPPGSRRATCVPKTCAAAGLQLRPERRRLRRPADRLRHAVPPARRAASAASASAATRTVAPDGGPLCMPKTCADFPMGTCGQQSDGCGGLTANCGSVHCPGPVLRRRRARLSAVATSPRRADGAPPCTPKTCTDLGYNCGQASDGCGGHDRSVRHLHRPAVLRRRRRRTSAAATTAHGAGRRLHRHLHAAVVQRARRELRQSGRRLRRDDGRLRHVLQPAVLRRRRRQQMRRQQRPRAPTAARSSPARPRRARTTAPAPAVRRPTAAAGMTANCGTCVNPQFCGGGGPGLCGGNNAWRRDGAIISPCVPQTCSTLGYNCGLASDGCGGTIGPCGSCTAPLFCGGGGANVCGVGVGDGGLVFGTCDAGVTTVSGTAVAGTDPTRGFGNPDPIYNALVYIPATTPQPFSAGVACTQCGAEVTGQPDRQHHHRPRREVHAHERAGRRRRTSSSSSVDGGAWCPSPVTRLRDQQRRQRAHAADAERGQQRRRQHPADGDRHGQRRPDRVRPPQDGRRWTASSRAPTGTGRVQLWPDNGGTIAGTSPAATLEGLRREPRQLRHRPSPLRGRRGRQDAGARSRTS